MGIVEVATRRPVTVAMLFVAITLFGAVALTRLNVNLLPDLSYPTLTVRTELTGAAPVEIESLVSKPIEEALGTIKNVRELRSHSRTGRSDVIIAFEWGTDMNVASVDVREKLDILFLPLEAERPVLLRFDPSTEPIIRIALAREATATLSDADLRQLRRLAEDDIRETLDSVPGVAAVKVSGGLEEEIQITVDQEKLAQLNIAIDEVASRIRAENVNLSGGRLEQGNQRFLVRTVNEYESLDDIRNTILMRIEERPVYVRDIATVTRGHKDREAITRIDGIEAVELAVYKEGDANTVQVAARVRNDLERINETLDDSVALSVIQDQSRYIQSAIDNVAQAAVIGGIIAVLVLYGFLRNLRATVIIGATIPLAIVGTFALMYFSDVSLNIMSLGGIALAVGLLVDNSVVVLENIARRRELGDANTAAALTGTHEVASAITASTLTTIAVFLPMVFVTGIAGQLFRDQALTVTFALILSLLLALLLIPMLTSFGNDAQSSDDGQADDAGAYNLIDRAVGSVLRVVRLALLKLVQLISLLLSPFAWVFTAFYRAAARLYRPALSRALQQRVLVVATAIALFAGSVFLLLPRLGTELIPQLAQGEFNAAVRLSPGTPLVATDQAVSRAYQAIAEHPAVTRSYSVAGTGNRIDANPVDAGEHTGTLSVFVRSSADEAAVIGAIRNEIRAIPGIRYEFSRPELLALATPLEVVVRGFDLSDLQATSERIAERLRANPRFEDVRSSVEGGNPEIQIEFDQERAAALGVASRDIADRVVANVRGSLATRYTWRDTKIDVTVRSVDNRDSSIQEVRELIVNPNSARPVTLDAVADIGVGLGPAEIRRIDQERVGIVSATPAFGDLGTATTVARALLADEPLPAGVSIAVVGQSADMEASIRSMQFSMLLAIFLVYLVMASQFESLRHPFVILLTVPLALIGAVGGLAIAGMSISVVALIGAIMLVGIVVNNGIVLIDLINQLRREGRSTDDAIREAAATRLRPILITTLTTALGLLPMAIGWGDGSEVRAPMAVTVIGGLLTSTLLTLFVVPAVYSLFEGRNREAQPSDTRVGVVT
ncbi:MAG: efflux RND transporter permease subunit [Pseudomonadota bacterium]